MLRTPVPLSTTIGTSSILMFSEDYDQERMVLEGRSSRYCFKQQLETTVLDERLTATALNGVDYCRGRFRLAS